MNRRAHNLRRDLVRAAFEEWFGVTPALAELLVVLFEIPGEARSWRDLGLISKPNRPISRGAFQVRVCELRKVLDSEAIDTIEDGVYQLTEIGQAECRRALSEVGGAMLTLGQAA